MSCAASSVRVRAGDDVDEDDEAELGRQQFEPTRRGAGPLLDQGGDPRRRRVVLGHRRARRAPRAAPGASAHRRRRTRARSAASIRSATSWAAASGVAASSFRCIETPHRRPDVPVDRDVVGFLHGGLGEGDREGAGAQVEALAQRLDVDDDVGVRQRGVDGGLDPVGDQVAGDQRLVGGGADRRVGEVVAARLAQAQLAQLDARRGRGSPLRPAPAPRAARCPSAPARSRRSVARRR